MWPQQDGDAPLARYRMTIACCTVPCFLGWGFLVRAHPWTPLERDSAVQTAPALKRSTLGILG